MTGEQNADQTQTLQLGHPKAVLTKRQERFRKHQRINWVILLMFGMCTLVVLGAPAVVEPQILHSVLWMTSAAAGTALVAQVHSMIRLKKSKHEVEKGPPTISIAPGRADFDRPWKSRRSQP